MLLPTEDATQARLGEDRVKYSLVCSRFWRERKSNGNGGCDWSVSMGTGLASRLQGFSWRMTGLLNCGLCLLSEGK
ncbi:hypothetical protein BN1723_004639 [Verticillium longisporum]|uniref:Uncharacterized protein n=1 Tax=Verticillium longisporum TaxID=100787 RepID=A0A0G4MZW9_VERLO|nr:hypothetical protein BN1723_004639 [Verticillium longisporum]